MPAEGGKDRTAAEFRGDRRDKKRWKGKRKGRNVNGHGHGK